MEEIEIAKRAQRGHLTAYSDSSPEEWKLSKGYLGKDKLVTIF